MPSDIIIERPLGQGENFFRCRTELGFYYNFASVAAFSKNITKDLELLYKALRKSILDYHILVCNVFKDFEKKTSIIRPIEQATFGDIVSFEKDLFSPENKPVSEKFLHDLCRTEYFHFNVEKPLFKVIVSGTHDVGATFEHTLFDGVVSMYFQEILLENLAYCDENSKLQEYVELYGPVPEEINLDTPIFNYSIDKKFIKNSLPPPLEMAMQDPSIDYSDNNPNHYSKMTPEGFPEKWPGRFPASKEFSVAFKTVNISPQQFTQILKKCKENGVTFTSYFDLIQALVLNPMLGDQHYSLNMVAITLRRFLTPDKVDDGYKDILTKAGYRLLGMYANMGLPQLIPPVKEFSWDQVREINALQAQSVKNDKLLSIMKKWYDEASLVGDNAHFFDHILGNRKADSVKISNLGLAKFPVYENGGNSPWTVNDIVFAQDLAPGAAEFVFDLVSSVKGGLNIVMSYFDHRFDDTKHENFDVYPGILKELLIKYAS